MKYIAQVGKEFYAFLNKNVEGLIYSIKLSGESGVRFDSIDEDTTEILRPSIDSLVTKGHYLEGEKLNLSDYRNLLEITEQAMPQLEKDAYN